MLKSIVICDDEHDYDNHSVVNNYETEIKNSSKSDLDVLTRHTHNQWNWILT